MDKQVKVVIVFQDPERRYDATGWLGLFVKRDLYKMFQTGKDGIIGFEH